MGNNASNSRYNGRRRARGNCKLRVRTIGGCIYMGMVCLSAAYQIQIHFQFLYLNWCHSFVWADILELNPTFGAIKSAPIVKTPRYLLYLLGAILSVDCNPNECCQRWLFPFPQIFPFPSWSTFMLVCVHIQQFCVCMGVCLWMCLFAYKSCGC